MDINYFITVLQQNTETIKQLNERIKLLEDENKQHNEIINDFFKTDATYYGYSVLSEAITNNHKSIMMHGFPHNINYHENSTISTSIINNSLVEKLHYFPYLKRFAFTNFTFNSILDSKLKSDTITSLVISVNIKHTWTNDEYDAFHNIIAFKWTLDGIKLLPNLEILEIYYGCGLYDVCRVLKSTNHKIKKIIIDFADLIFKDIGEYDSLRDYSKTNQIELQCYNQQSGNSLCTKGRNLYINSMIRYVNIDDEYNKLHTFS